MNVTISSKLARTVIILSLVLMSVAGTAFLLTRADTDSAVPQGSFPALRPEDLSGFAVAEPGRTFDFPADHGPHPDFQTEWWYFTGNLETDEGRQFGYQLTFFRRGLMPISEFRPRESAWATNEVYLAHFTLSDVANDRFTYFEKFSRGGDIGIAGATSEPFEVWLEDWEIRTEADGTYSLTASQDGINLKLSLVDGKGPILQGDKGFSSKGPDAEHASYYYSLTHLESQGTIDLGSESYEVTGTTWMDHEFSTGALAAGQVGWDWFGLQLDNDYEIMAFQLRDEHGALDDASTFVLISPAGSMGVPDAFSVSVQDTWTSPHTGATYPAEWIITVPELDLEISITPLISDQELNVSYTYWEGAVEIEGTFGGQVVQGNGYVELTGYAESMAGQF